MNYFLKKKKWLAWVIMLTFLFTSFLPSNIMAGNSVAEAAEDQDLQEQLGKQIAYNGVIVTSADEKVQVRKTVSPTGEENKFKITLNVETEDEVTSYVKSSSADVVLVIDRSGSMDKNNNGRIAAAKKAAQDFVDIMLGADSAEGNRVGVVAFNSSATEVSGLTTKTGKEELKTKISQITATGGTNIQGGLHMANSMLTDPTREQFIVVLSDGEPTYSFKGTETASATNFFTRYRDRQDDEAYGYRITEFDYRSVKGNGSDYRLSEYSRYSIGDNTVYDNGLATVSEAYFIKNAGTKIYSVFLGKDNEAGIGVMEAVSSGEGYNKTTDNLDELAELFKEFSEEILNKTKAWKVTDPMSQYIGFDGYGDSNIPPGATFDSKTKTLTWDLLNKDVRPVKLGENRYQYSLNYYITLDTTATGFVEGAPYVTNGTTELSYFIGDELNESTVKKVKFDVPKVKGYNGEFTFIKKAVELGDLPETVLPGATFKLKGTATGTRKAIDLTATSNSNGVVSFANIPAGVYTLTETQAPTGYILAKNFSKQVVVSYGKTTIDGTSSLGDVLNEREKVSVSGSKTWTGLEEGTVHPTVTINLYQDRTEGSEPFRTETIENGESGYSFTNLPKYAPDGHEYAYTVEEVAINGYTPSYTETANGYDIVNAFDAGTVSVSGSKTWTGLEEGAVHPTVTINLYQDRTEGSEPFRTETIENGESGYSFTNLPKYAPDGHEYAYTVEEVAINGYTPSYTETANGYDIVNAFDAGTVSVSGSKTWTGLEEGTVHPTVTINLYQDRTEGSEPFRTETIENGESGYSFTNLPKYAPDGHEYAYTVEEVAINGYTPSYTETANGYDIANAFDAGTVSVSGSKTWTGLEEGAVHPTVTINLYQDRTEGSEPFRTETIENGESGYSFTNLPKYAPDGHEYAYTVEEVAINGYTPSYTETANGYDIANAFDAGTVSVSGSKTWTGLEEGAVHPTVTINLYQDRTEGSEPFRTETIENGESGYSFTNLPKYAPDGHEYAYTVEEVAINGYTPSYTETANGYDIVNAFDAGTVSVSGSKTWTGLEEGAVHPTVTINLYQDRTEGSEPFRTETIENGESGYSFTNLPKYAPDGHEYAYTVEEVAINGYTPSYTETANGYDIVNAFDAGTVSVSGSKTWTGLEEGAVHPTVTINLYQDRTEGSEPFRTETIENGESGYSFTNLPKYAPDGHEYAYTVEEVAINGYTPSYTETANGYDIVNAFDAGTVSVSGSKTWTGLEEGAVHPTVTINLYQDRTEGSEPFRTETIENGESGYSFTNLPKYAPDGHEYAYTVEEVAINGYTPSYTETANGYDIVNAFDAGTVSVSGSKTWTGLEEGAVHPTVTINLYQDRTEGSEPFRTETIENGESGYSFTNLPKYAPDGHEYAYTVEEVAINGYTPSYTETANGYDIVNAFDAGTVSVSGSKTWTGLEEGAVHPTVTINLYQDRTEGSEPFRTETIENGESGYSFTNLPKYAPDGHEYAYTVEEVAINGYTSEKDENNNFTNTYTGGETFSISGLKKWVAPEEIKTEDFVVTIGLKQNGNLFDTREVSTTTNWTYEFTGLPYYAPSGEAYEYTVAELNVPDNFKSKVVEVGANQFNIINTYDRSADTEVSVQKRWIDFGTNVTTHSAITIELYQNNVLYDTVQLSDENDWNTTFVELPKYDANQQPFDYTVKEVAVAGYTTTILEVKDNEFVVTNTLMLGKPGEITVEKQTTGDKKPGNDVKFKFELQVQITRPEGTNVLFDAMALSELDLGDAASNLNDAMDAVQASAMLVTSSSAYQYLLTEKENEFATEATTLMGVEYEGTTTSAVTLVVTPSELSENEYELQYNLTKNIVETLVDLSDEYRKYTLEDMLVALAGEIPLDREDGYAVAMDMNAVTRLIGASRVYSDLAALEPGAPATTTPSALQIFMNGSTSPSALTYVADGDYYAVDFWLANGEKAVFDIQATTGSAISYKIVETLDPATEKDYVGTSIFDSVNNQTTSGTAIGFVAYNENEPMSYLFTNNYANNPYIPPVDPVDPVDPGKPDDPTDPDIEIPDPDVPLTDPEEPVIEIEDPDVPLIDMPGEEVEIDEPEVPLGDAPQTGDNSNTIPFVVLMLAAACGLVVTRRKLN